MRDDNTSRTSGQGMTQGAGGPNVVCRKVEKGVCEGGGGGSKVIFMLITIFFLSFFLLFILKGYNRQKEYLFSLSFSHLT